MKNKLNKTEFREKELSILREAVDNAEKSQKETIVNSPIIKSIIKIVETFLKENKLMCYGGTAINNILPEHEKFYNKATEIPDYDFFSSDAVSDAKKLADIYYKAGFDEVEAKAGVHTGTYKVFVNFIPIADITQMHHVLFEQLFKEAIKVDNIYYVPANFLRMSAYLELSRPKGDIGRWEKVMKRLLLLNKYYPIKETECNISHFIRKFEEPTNKLNHIYNIIKNSIIDQKLVFFGGYAIYSYGNYLPPDKKKLLLKYPDFDVLALDPLAASEKIVKKLNQANIKDTRILKKTGLGEVISVHYEIRIGNETVAFIYKPLACHSYNTIKVNNKIVKIATIDTMLSFYLAFIYADRQYYDVHRILCMAQYLFNVQARNRLKQTGVLKRFSTKCYGDQTTLENIRAKKTRIFKELKNDKNSEEYEKYFLRYLPGKTKKHKKYNKKKNKTNKKKN
jgi:hypothetical protein